MNRPSEALEPLGNSTWVAISPPDRTALLPYMRRVHLPRRDRIGEAGDQVEIVYFPETADIVNAIDLPDWRTGMASTVGRDGLTGLAAVLAGEPLGWDIRVLIEGHGWSLPASVLDAQIQASPSLRRLLLQVTHHNQVEAARNAVCNARHQATPRLARLILTMQDRTGLAEFRVHQDELAELLGVLRSSIVACSKALSGTGAIRTGRGRFFITDRAALQAAACSCYSANLGRMTPAPARQPT